jgi:hypothetical protein
MSEHRPSDESLDGIRHEHSDVSIRPLAVFLVGLTILLMVASAVVAGFFNLFESQAAKLDVTPPLADVPAPAATGPQLQVVERRDLEEFRQRESERLATAQWIDKEAGIARIPIQDAIELTLERGLPHWPAVEASGGGSKPAPPAADGNQPAPQAEEATSP